MWRSKGTVKWDGIWYNGSAACLALFLYSIRRFILTYANAQMRPCWMRNLWTLQYVSITDKWANQNKRIICCWCYCEEAVKLGGHYRQAAIPPLGNAVRVDGPAWINEFVHCLRSCTSKCLLITAAVAVKFCLYNLISPVISFFQQCSLMLFLFLLYNISEQILYCIWYRWGVVVWHSGYDCCLTTRRC